METTEPMKTKVFTTLIRPDEKKIVQVVDSLAPALTLTLSLTQILNHLANKPWHSTLFGLIYLTNNQRHPQWTIIIYVLFISENRMIANDFPTCTENTQASRLQAKGRQCYISVKHWSGGRWACRTCSTAPDLLADNGNGVTEKQG